MHSEIRHNPQLRLLREGFPAFTERINSHSFQLLYQGSLFYLRTPIDRLRYNFCSTLHAESPRKLAHVLNRDGRIAILSRTGLLRR